MTLTMNTNTTEKTMIFLMGLPASGKTTFARANFSTFAFCDSDEFKMVHPDYDPERPSELHEWSCTFEEALFLHSVVTNENWVIDGTGTNSEKMVRRIKMAQANGFTAKLVYVTVSLATSLKRNAARERKVPEDVLTSKALDIATSFELVAPYADVVVVVDNEDAK